ncbi:MAG: hypothetical protein OEV37_02305 [Candidatus Berkelbacteria bacterium]|nr:hypothetical protein [Candidatus Berkelbacteria bacterium]
MRNIYLAVGLVVVFFLLEVGIAARYLGEFSPVLVVPLLYLISRQLSLKQMLVLSLVFGLLFDLSLLDHVPFVTLFFIAQTLILNYLSQKILDFSAPFVLVSAGVVLALVFSLLKLLVLSEFVLGVGLGKILLFNLVLSALICSAWVIISRRYGQASI